MAQICEISYCEETATTELKIRGNMLDKWIRWKVCGKHFSQICTVLLSPTKTQVTRLPREASESDNEN